MKARSVLFSGASFFESSSSFTKILTARLSRFICNDVTTTQELRDALEAKGLDSSGLKAVLLSRLEESLEGGEGGGEEEKEEDDRDWFNLLEKIERSFTRGERLDRFFEFDWMCVYSSKRARFGAIDETIESGSIDLHARRGGFWILRLGVIVRYDQVGGVDE